MLSVMFPEFRTSAHVLDNWWGWFTSIKYVLAAVFPQTTMTGYVQWENVKINISQFLKIYFITLGPLQVIQLIKKFQGFMFDIIMYLAFIGSCNV